MDEIDGLHGNIVTDCLLWVHLTALPNVFVERLWRSVKYEEVYLHAYDSVSAAKAGLNRYFRFYNHERPYQSLEDKTPSMVYHGFKYRKTA